MLNSEPKETDAKWAFGWPKPDIIYQMFGNIPHIFNEEEKKRRERSLELIVPFAQILPK